VTPPARTTATRTTQAAKPTPATKKPAASATAPRRGGELRIVLRDDLTSMDPIHAWGPTASAVYDSLFAWRPDAQGAWGVQPLLATSWELGADRLVVTLRENVTFHDGSALTAEVVAWNVARMVQHPRSLARGYLSSVDPDRPAQALDPLTAQVNLTRPSASLLGALSDAVPNTAIVSKKAADEQGEAWMAQHPVGTGPFRFVSFTPGDRLILERHRGHWRMGADGKSLPYADRATYRVIADPPAQLAEMRNGAADWISPVRGGDVADAKQIAHAVYVESAFRGTKRQLVFNAVRPPFQDNLKLRQAIQHALDRAALARALGGGLGIALPYDVVPGSIGYDTAVPTYAHDPDRAKRLLAESGIKLPFEVRLTTTTGEADQRQAQQIRAMLEQVGITLTLDAVAPSVWEEKVRVAGDFELATRQSGVVAEPAHDLLASWAPGGSAPLHRATVPGLLDALQKADAEPDERRRHQLFVDAQKLMHASAWSGALWFENGNALVHTRIQGYSATGRGPLREAEWWINE
jgi:peptide/nickel transport system substrate-binding protein